jgi:hypothetical protein
MLLLADAIRKGEERGKAQKLSATTLNIIGPERGKSGAYTQASGRNIQNPSTGLLLIINKLQAIECK